MKGKRKRLKNVKIIEIKMKFKIIQVSEMLLGSTKKSILVWIYCWPGQQNMELNKDDNQKTFALSFCVICYK